MPRAAGSVDSWSPSWNGDFEVASRCDARNGVNNFRDAFLNARLARGRDYNDRNAARREILLILQILIGRHQ
jgi:hypothetical protein